MRSLALGIFILGVAAIPSVVLAQRDLEAGLGAHSLNWQIESLTGEPTNFGVVHLNGEIFVSTSKFTGSPPSVNFVSVFDGSGSLLRTFLQPGLSQLTVNGFYDGTSDGEVLVWGFDFGFQIVNESGGLHRFLRTQNGSLVTDTGLISGNITDAGNAGSVRALAYDRSGNGGDGSFWVGNLSSSVFEVDTAGDVLRSYPNVGELSHGFALDPTSANGGPASKMWINSTSGGSHLAEYDLTTGMLTGNHIDMGQHPHRDPGGMDILPSSVVPGSAGSGYHILHLQRGREGFLDEVRAQRLHLDVAGMGVPPRTRTRLGTLEPDLLSSVDDEILIPRTDSHLRSYTATSTTLNVYFDIGRNPGDGMGTGGLNGTPAVIFANIGADADFGVDAKSNAIGIRELAHLQPLLTIPSAIRTPRSRSLVLTNDPGAVALSEWRIHLDPGMPFQNIGECVRFQGLWVDGDVPFLPIALTNQLRICRAADPTMSVGVLAECVGPNSFNQDASAGFFRVINNETVAGKSIVKTVFTTRPGDPSNSAATQALVDTFFSWHTSQSNVLHEEFDAGNSLLPECVGTFRNRCAEHTGLIFEGTPKPPCDNFANTTARRGWRGSDGTPRNWKTLTFNFLPDHFFQGRILEFDCDTDGGLGINGGAMAGIIVEVYFKDGSMTEGVMATDPMDPNRAFVQL